MLHIGKLVATHGLNGTLVMTHLAGKSDWLKKDQAIFVAVNKESRIPFFVVQFKAINTSEYQVQLDDINSVEAAKKLVGKKVFVPAESLGTATLDNPLLWIGFDVVDAEKGALGPLLDMAQTGHQWVGTVNYQGKEVLLPMVKPILVEVNLRNKFIRMDLPEGILDL